jgi:hypothetical protein
MLWCAKWFGKKRASERALLVSGGVAPLLIPAKGVASLSSAGGVKGRAQGSPFADKLVLCACVCGCAANSWGQWISAKQLAMCGRSIVKKARKDDQIDSSSFCLRDVPWTSLIKRWTNLNAKQQWNELMDLFRMEQDCRIPTHLADTTASIHDLTQLIMPCPVCLEQKPLKLCQGCGIVRLCGKECLKKFWNEQGHRCDNCVFIFVCAHYMFVPIICP